MSFRQIAPYRPGRLLLSTFILALCFPVNSFGQVRPNIDSNHSVTNTPPDISFGISGSTSRGFLWGEAPVYGGGLGCGAFNAGTTNGGEIGLRARFQNFPEPGLFIAVRPSWRSERGRLVEPLVAHDGVTSEDDRYSLLFDEVSERVVRVEREAELDVSAQSMRLALFGGTWINEVLLVSAGPVVGYNYRTSTTQSERIVSPEEIAYPNGQRRLEVSTGIEYETRPFYAGLGAAGRIELPVGDRLHLGFDLDLAWDFRSPIVGAPWNAIRIEGGIGLQYHLRERGGPLRAGPADPPPTTQSPARLSASIELYTERPDGSENDVIDVEFNEIDFCTVVLPESSIEIPEKLPAVQGNQGSIRPGDLVRLSDSGLHRRSFELIGLRLSSNPSRKFEIVYSVDVESEGDREAARLRDWLRDEQGISEERIALVEGTPGSPPPGDVIIRAAEETTPAPLRAHRLDREFGAPTVRIRTSQEAEAGVRGWEVALSNDSMVIARYSSAQPEGRGGTGIDWSLLYSGNDIDSSRLEAVFTVQDSVGSRAVSHTQNQMIVRRVRVVVGRIIDLENNTTKILFALPQLLAPELRDRALEMLLGRFRTVTRSSDYVAVSQPISHLLPSERDDIVEPVEVASLVEVFGSCGGFEEGIDPESVIVITRIHQ